MWKCNIWLSWNKSNNYYFLMWDLWGSFTYTKQRLYYVVKDSPLFQILMPKWTVRFKLSLSLYLSVADSASQTLLGSFRSVQKTQMGQNNKSMEILGLIYGKRQKVIGFGLNFMFFWGKLQFFYQFFLENVNILPRFAKFWKKLCAILGLIY